MTPGAPEPATPVSGEPEASDMFDRDWRVPELRPGDEIGGCRIAELSASAITMRTNYVLSLVMLIGGIAMLVFDVWLFSSPVLSHMLLASNDMTSLSLKGAMIGFPLIGIPFVLYSLGRSFAVDVAAGVLRRRWLFVFGPTTAISALQKIEIVIDPPISASETATVYAHLVLVDGSAQTLLEFPSVDVPRTDMTSSDQTDFAKLLSLARDIAVLTRRPLQVRGPADAISAVNRRMLDQVQAAP
jgi:hypothetical protein